MNVLCVRQENNQIMINLQNIFTLFYTEYVYLKLIDFTFINVNIQNPSYYNSVYKNIDSLILPHMVIAYTKITHTQQLKFAST